MKKHIAITIISLLLPLLGISQTRDLIVTDPALTAAISGGIALEVTEQQQIHEQQEKIVDLQSSIAACQTIVKKIEEKTYKYLSTASDIIVAANYIVGMTKDIEKSYENLSECLDLVADEPYLVLLTIETDTLIKSRIIDLFAYVTNVAFVYDDGQAPIGGNGHPKNLMNNAERMEFVYHVSNELKVIRGYTAYLKSHLKVAKKQTVFRNLCPKTYQVVRNCEYTYNSILRDFHL